MASVDGFDDNTMEMLTANLPSNAFTTTAPDPRLERARLEMERTNQITPLLKEELRWRILSKRLEKGEPEIDINSVEPKSYELTEEEKAKRERRRAQNRRAAKKCREKRKMKTLSDAEKYRDVRNENQQLRNHVTYLKHKEEVFKNFCIEHILNGNCSTPNGDESMTRRLLALLQSNTRCGSSSLPQTLVTSTSTEPPTRHSQPENIASSGVVDIHFQVKGHGSFSSMDMPLPTTAAQAVFQAEQEVTAIQELEELPVNEISSLLPTEPDFSVSDQSLSPALSPTTLFNTMSPTCVSLTSSGVGSSSFFSQLTPSTSYSGHNGSSFSSSSDELLATPNAGSHVLVSSPHLTGPAVSTPDLSSAVSTPDLSSAVSTPELGPPVSTSNLGPAVGENCRYGGPTGNQGILGKLCVLHSYGGMTSSPGAPYQTGKYCLQGRYSQDPNLNSTVYSDNVKPNDDGHHIVSHAGTNSVIINTAFLGEIPANLDCLLTNYLIAEPIEDLENNVSSNQEEPFLQIVPDSPLSPVSLASPHVSLSPRSPSATSVDLKLKDCSSARFQPSQTGVSSSTPNPGTPARHLARRASSTTSVPSPYFNHQVSITLSPPPSVPSPISSGVPESPPILALSSVCDESSYMPHFSPISSLTSDDCSPARFFDLSKNN